MIVLGWLGIAFAAWILDAAITGRKPLATLKEVVSTGAIPAAPPEAGAAPAAGFVAGTTVQGPTLGGSTGTNTTPSSQTLDTNPWPTAPSAGTYSGNLDGWLEQARQVLEANGYPASQWNANDVKLIINYESNGNPYAVNNYDINAVNGHPSIGVMQTIRSTFNGNALPGHYDIFNPVDNIIAGVRYAQSRYGGIENVPGVISVHNGNAYEPY